MMNTRAIDIRTGLRAAVAVALASAVAHVFGLQRSYWVIMVAVVVLTETWGASVQKAVQRVTATAAGCVIGWQVQRLAGNAEWVQVLMLLLCVFIAIYFRGYSYAWMMFFITIYVVFLFSLLGEWDVAIAILRLKDTIIGSAVAVAATVIVRPARPNQLRSDLMALWTCAQAQLAAVLSVLAPVDADGHDAAACRDNLYRTVETLQAHLAVSPYENILRPLAVRDIREIVDQTEALGRHVLVLAEIVRAGSPHRLQPLEPELGAMATAAMRNIRDLAADSADDSEALLRSACDRLEQRANELRRSGDIGSDELLTVCSLAYHVVRAGVCVRRIVDLRRKLPATAEVPAARDVPVTS